MSNSSYALHKVSRFMEVFPRKNVVAFTYGSGVFQQANRPTAEKNMVDVIIAVDNAKLWHEDNVRKNPSHYSFLKYFGSSFIETVQHAWGAKVYFNTLVRFEDMTFKYGVVTHEDLLMDLFDWDTLYLSGRLHKPVHFLYPVMDRTLTQALRLNLESAARAALIKLPAAFSEREFYHSIVGLSYGGDFRMIVGEDKNKVSNIVDGQFEDLKNLYDPIVKHFNEWMEISKGQGFQDVSSLARLHHLNLLPKTAQLELMKEITKDGRHRDIEEVLRAVAAEVDCGEVLDAALQRIVQRSSLTQSLKGILTAGAYKSMIYSHRKMKKWWASRRKKYAKTAISTQGNS
ncbi:unnamed protein product [Darwinula stevensoni]|uniref:Phosphatidate cytidylyltransferase, mitochondrial n=1 Tax=Darwinula stevensoni TaxID=69355 RepID=A0A7R9AAE1_9CRUS|nr:unnamed protein product [Darwinula stevensoni]CAG0898168.1 unnamed protein product [Darwinula stevensoni]